MSARTPDLLARFQVIHYIILTLAILVDQSLVHQFNRVNVCLSTIVSIRFDPWQNISIILRYGIYASI